MINYRSPQRIQAVHLDWISSCRPSCRGSKERILKATRRPGSGPGGLTESRAYVCDVPGGSLAGASFVSRAFPCFVVVPSRERGAEQKPEGGEQGSREARKHPFSDEAGDFVVPAREPRGRRATLQPAGHATMARIGGMAARRPHDPKCQKAPKGEGMGGNCVCVCLRERLGDCRVVKATAAAPLAATVDYAAG